MGKKKGLAKTLKPFCLLAQRKGFALLAARPARQLSIADFAVDSSLKYPYYGKAFCSRKTAPTLKSLSKFVVQQKRATKHRNSFLWRRERDLNPCIHSCITRFRRISIFVHHNI